jgi:hypothetical protein
VRRLGDQPRVTTIAAVIPYEPLDSARESPGRLWSHARFANLGTFEEREGER